MYFFSVFGQKLIFKNLWGSHDPILCIFQILGLKQCCIPKTSLLGASEVSKKFVGGGGWWVCKPNLVPRLPLDLCFVLGLGQAFQHHFGHNLSDHKFRGFHIQGNRKTRHLVKSFGVIVLDQLLGFRVGLSGYIDCL